MNTQVIGLRSAWKIVGLCLALTFSTAMVASAKYSGGSGNENDPYQISTVADWEELAGSTEDWDKHFVLTADIDFGGESVKQIAPDKSSENGFQGTEFTGVFDGAGHVLRNGSINKPNTDYVGLFGKLGSDDEIRNLGVEGINVSGGGYVGGLVGRNFGTITSCYATGAVSGESGMVGGLVGYNDEGTIASCYATGAVSGSWDYVGGLVGYNDKGTITSCYATGAVSGDDHVGGLVGDNRDSRVIGSFWDIDTTSINLSDGGKGLTTEQMKTVSNFQNAGWGDYDWVVNEEEYPRLDWEGTGASAIPEAEPVPLVGDGTEDNPYQVGTIEEFRILNSHIEVLDKHIQLTADLDFNGAEIEPIGGLGPFTGEFDGNGHIISKGQINKTNSSQIGVFRQVGEGGEIKNLGVEEIDVSGGDYVGGLVGRNEGTITSCYATGAVSGSWDNVGGLVGYNDGGTITSCYATGTTSGGNDYVGGLVGNNYHGTITSCYTMGPVSGDDCVGGLVGDYNEGKITSCYATGAVSGDIDVGGLVGVDRHGTITSCYATGAVSGESNYVGGLVGDNGAGRVIGSFWDIDTTSINLSDGGKGLTTEQMKTVSNFQNAGWGDYNWVMNEGEYPRLDWEETGAFAIPEVEPVPLAGNGTEDNPYQVGAIEEFRILNSHIEVLDKHIQLTADLDFDGAEIEPIGGLGSFTGEFDGNGHVISKGQINKTNSSQIGVFRQVGEGGEIRNLGVEEINVSGDDYVGGLVGWNEGTITSCYATGAVSGGWNIGGLVGSSVGTITSCYATGTVSGEGNHVGGLVGRNYHGTITSCYATETVSGDYYVGGLVGSSVGTITSCYATGAVSGDDYVGGLVGYTSYGTITSCYATGVVSGSSYVGGLVGRNYHGTITSCYWDISTSGVIGSAGGEGRTTDQMTYPYSSDTYVDWDFEETWVADVDGQNGGYPYLQSVPLEPAVVLPELQILQILPDGTVELSLDAQAGSQYEIQAGPDLNTWTAITNITATNATTIFVDPAASGNDRRFYRAVVP